jgi:hypothetical protein
MAAIVAFALAAPASGIASSNSADAKLCQQGGWQTVGGADQTVFDNAGECTSYAARGGTVVPLLQIFADQRCVSPSSPPSSVCITVTGFGLEPESDAVITLVIEGEPLVFTEGADQQGTVTFETSAVCTAGSEEIPIAIFASAVTASGVPLSTGPVAFSIFCTRA